MTTTREIVQAVLEEHDTHPAIIRKYFALCDELDSLRGEFLFRGHPIRPTRFVFADTGLPVEDTWRERGCGHCGLASTPEGHDGCLGTLPGVVNACCGHGLQALAYAQFQDGSELRGVEAQRYFKEARDD